MRKFLATLVVLALLPGCSNDKKVAAPTTTAKTVDKPVEGGVLRMGTTRLTTLDPAQSRSVEELLIADQLFDGLTATDPKTSAAVGRLAKSWQVSPDQKSWDFFLNAGIKFSNGRPIEAKDVKYTLQRIAFKGSGSPGAELLGPIDGFQVVSQGLTFDLKGIVVVQPDILHINLTEPWAQLPIALASPQFGVVPQEAVDVVAPAAPFASEPSVSSGPFAFAKRGGDTIDLKKAPDSRAHLEGIQVKEFTDVASAYSAFVKKTLDWVRVPPEEVDAAGQRYGREHFQPYVAELFYGFNMKNPKFSDGRFREAVVRSIDRKAIANAVYGGTVKPLPGVVVDGIPGSADDPCGERCSYNVARAKQLIAEVFGTNPVPSIQIDYDQDPTQEKVAKAVEASMKEAGLTIELVAKPPGEYGDFVIGGQQELFRLGWIAAYPSPDAFITPLFRSAARDNLMGLNSKSVDDLIWAARSEPDLSKSTPIWHLAEQAVMQEMAVVPLSQFKLYSVTAKNVRGLDVTVMGTFDASSVWLARSES